MKIYHFKIMSSDNSKNILEMIIWQLQEKLKGEVVSLTEPAEGGGVVGPGPGLRKYRDVRNLRVVGEYNAETEQGQWLNHRTRDSLNRNALSRDIVNYTNTVELLPSLIAWLMERFSVWFCSYKIALHLILLGRCSNLLEAIDGCSVSCNVGRMGSPCPC